jgi:hypothetical protein
MSKSSSYPLDTYLTSYISSLPPSPPNKEKKRKKTKTKYKPSIPGKQPKS